MSASTGTVTCPRGHISAEPDYCSECGAKIQGATAKSANAPSSHAGTGEICPDCGTVREQKEIAFCEVCGYNFTTGAHGEVAILPSPSELAPPPLQAPETPSPPPESSHPGPDRPTQHWMVTVSVDDTLRTSDSPAAPTGIPPLQVDLHAPISLIGRRDDARGIYPEIALDHDEAVSRRHALLQLDPEKGLLLRDIGASNGTRLNGKDCEPMTDYPLNDNDEITLGHWSRLRVQSR